MGAYSQGERDSDLVNIVFGRLAAGARRRSIAGSYRGATARHLKKASSTEDSGGQRKGGRGNEIALDNLLWDERSCSRGRVEWKLSTERDASRRVAPRSELLLSYSSICWAHICTHGRMAEKYVRVKVNARTVD